MVTLSSHFNLPLSIASSNKYSSIIFVMDAMPISLSASFEYKILPVLSSIAIAAFAFTFGASAACAAFGLTKKPLTARDAAMITIPVFLIMFFTATSPSFE